MKTYGKISVEFSFQNERLIQQNVLDFKSSYVMLIQNLLLYPVFNDDIFYNHLNYYYFSQVKRTTVNLSINGTKDNIGLIAEDFYPVLERGDNSKVDGQDVQMALWLATQELIKENSELRKGLEDGKTQLPSLKAENSQLKSQLDNLESRIAALEGG